MNLTAADENWCINLTAAKSHLSSPGLRIYLKYLSKMAAHACIETAANHTIQLLEHIHREVLELKGQQR